MAVPALVIGLGGTGVKALTYAKQDLMRNNDGVVPPEITLLALDTTSKAESWWHDLRVVTRSGRSVPVRLQARLGEYVHIGGWSKPLVETNGSGGALAHQCIQILNLVNLKSTTVTKPSIDLMAQCLRSFG